MAQSSSHLERDRVRERKERQPGRNIDAEIERERDATLSRLILKFCTQGAAVNHVKTRRGKKLSSVLFMRAGTIWMCGVPYRWTVGSGSIWE